MSLTPSRWKRIALAAASLACAYALCFLTLVVTYVSLLQGRLNLRDLSSSIVPIGVVFAFAFVVLAMARRAGFAVLWLCILGMWAWTSLLQAKGFIGYSAPRGFVDWSLLALPLFGLGALGVPTTMQAPFVHIRVRPEAMLFIVWTLLLATAIYFDRVESDVLPLRRSLTLFHGIAPFVFGPAPVLITGLEIVRVWVGTGRAGAVHDMAAA